ncbi:MAG: hypothetical protein JWR15_2912 [Prosthecobacter sp.]|nr:hypothetical protein [Prosthecobacter sp.]
MRWTVCLKCSNKIPRFGRTNGTRTPDETEAGDKQDDSHDGAAVMTNEACLPAPFEEAVKLIVSFLKHAMRMRRCGRASMWNGSQYCCWEVG